MILLNTQNVKAQIQGLEVERNERDCLMEWGFFWEVIKVL